MEGQQSSQGVLDVQPNKMMENQNASNNPPPMPPTASKIPLLVAAIVIVATVGPGTFYYMSLFQPQGTHTGMMLPLYADMEEKLDGWLINVTKVHENEYIENTSSVSVYVLSPIDGSKLTQAMGEPTATTCNITWNDFGEMNVIDAGDSFWIQDADHTLRYHKFVIDLGDCTAEVPLK